MSDLKQLQKAARDCIKAEKWAEALDHCKAALKLDKSNELTFILAGKSAFGLNQLDNAEGGYKKAIGINAGSLPAWKGLTEVYEAKADQNQLIEVYSKLISLNAENSDQYLQHAEACTTTLQKLQAPPLSMLTPWMLVRSMPNIPAEKQVLVHTALASICSKILVCRNSWRYHMTPAIFLDKLRRIAEA